MDSAIQVVSDLTSSDPLQVSPKLDSTVQETKCAQDVSPSVVSPSNGASDVLASDELPLIPKSEIPEEQGNHEENTCMASPRIGNSNAHPSDELQGSCSDDVRACEAKPNQEGTGGGITPGAIVEYEVASDNDKHMQTYALQAQEMQVSLEVSSPTVVPEKAVDDGYNWRKYGQKNVKGNEFIRSYYKCTHSSCLVKKQVERSHDGQITDTLYFGTHYHPKALPIPVSPTSTFSVQEEKIPEPPAAGEEEKVSNQHVQDSCKMEVAELPNSLALIASETDVSYGDSGSNRNREIHSYETPEPKRRRKQDCHSVDATQGDKQHAGESRLIVRTTSDVDIVNDGYRWRKYGQKLVKGNVNPRSYYRCSNSGCPVKKHVERAAHNSRVVITTYEGQHDHDIPAARTVTPNTAGSNANPTPLSRGESRAESDESDIIGHEVVVQYSLHPESISNEHRRPDAEPVHS